MGTGPPCAACNVREHTFCADLRDDEIARLQLITSRYRFAPKQLIFREGDAAHHLFNVLEGAVKLHKSLADGRRQVVGFLFPGDFMGLVRNAQYAYSAEAVTTVAVCGFERARFEKLMSEFAGMEKRLLAKCGDELIAAHEQMLLLGRKSAFEKIASFLLALSGRAVKRGEPDNPVFLPMTRSDIADYLGLTTETVSRTFSELRRKGVIAPDEDGSVRLVARAALNEIASVT